MTQLQPPYPLIRDAILKGRVIPFLGSGASLGGREAGAKWIQGQTSYLPTATELARHLADVTEFPDDEEPELTKVAQYYDVIGGRYALNQELHSIFNCDYPLTSLHTFLAEVTVPLLIVTTNYDDCIERAFNTKGRAFDLIIHTTDASIGDQLLWWEYGASEPRKILPNKLDIDLDSVTVIYKMHGAVDRRVNGRDQYVITEDDYIDFLARMTKNKAIPAIFAEPFQTSHFLFLGYGLRDWNLRVVLNRIEKDLRRPKGIKSWAVQYNPSPLEQRFWQERGVEVYNKMLDEFVTKLNER
ncbi:MAG TPA: SIR2 family protein [Pyrinomonadaceae bacterium]|nr:SIR2 family protein [Pyrinomonadaceae bacterium]